MKSAVKWGLKEKSIEQKEEIRKYEKEHEMKNTKVIAAIAVFIMAVLSVSLYSVTGEGKQEKEKRIMVGQPLSAVITSS